MIYLNRTNPNRSIAFHDSVHLTRFRGEEGTYISLINHD